MNIKKLSSLDICHKSKKKKTEKGTGISICRMETADIETDSYAKLGSNHDTSPYSASK